MNEQVSGPGRAELGSEHRPWDGPRSVSISRRIGKARVPSDVSCEWGNKAACVGQAAEDGEVTEDGSGRGSLDRGDSLKCALEVLGSMRAPGGPDSMREGNPTLYRRAHGGCE